MTAQTQKPVKPTSQQVEKDNNFKTQKYQNQMHEAQGKQKPGKATDRMSPQFPGYAEGRKPNVGGDSVKRPNADKEKAQQVKNR